MAWLQIEAEKRRHIYASAMQVAGEGEGRRHIVEKACTGMVLMLDSV